MTTQEQFVARVESFLKRHNMPPTRFGQQSCGDPRLVFELRGGRAPRVSTMDRVDAWMQRFEQPVQTPAPSEAVE